jgi:hypothetical protein
MRLGLNDKINIRISNFYGIVAAFTLSCLFSTILTFTPLTGILFVGICVITVGSTAIFAYPLICSFEEKEEYVLY